MEIAEFSLFLVKNSLIDTFDNRFKTILKWQDADLFRRPLNFLFPADAHNRLDRLLEHDSVLLENVVFPRVPLRLKTGGYINFDMKMKSLGEEARQLDFYRPGKTEASSENNQPPTDMYSFFNFVEGLLNSPFDADMALTMVSVDALRADSLLADETKLIVKDEIEAGLRQKAVGGTVGMLDEASYGLIVTGGFDEEAYEVELRTVAARLELNSDVLQAKTVSLDIDDRTLSSNELQQALGHSRGVFLGEIDDEASLDSLTGVIDGINHNRRLIQTALKEYNYRVSARCVSDAVANVSLAVLQQGKVNLDGRIRQPDEILVMPDHPDLALQHDIAQLDELVRVRVRKTARERNTPDYYQLCRSTLIQEKFFDDLASILQKYSENSASIGFRLVGLPPVKRGGLHWLSLNRLADLGHPIWIDRLGDAVVAPEALGCAKGGFVEMPVELMRKLAGHFDGKDLMEQLIDTWDGLGVGVLSCDLPDYEMKTLAHEIGIKIAVEDPV